MRPQVIAVAAAAAGVALGVSGVYVLAGGGWALIAGAAACFGLAAVLLRGLPDGEPSNG
jgi:hypothetical protein